MLPGYAVTGYAVTGGIAGVSWGRFGCARPIWTGTAVPML